MSPTLGWVGEDTMAPALDDRGLWRLLAALAGVRLAVVNALGLLFQWVPPRSVVQVRRAG